jgi:hypothetical protein
MATKTQRKLAKVAADDLVQRGLITDRDVELTDGRWVYFDYVDKAGKKLSLEHRPVGFEATLIVIEEPTVVEQARWKIGDEQYYEPDGQSLYVVGDGDGAASKSSNFGLLMQSLDKAGLPKALQAALAENSGAINGLKGHLLRHKITSDGATDRDGRPMKDREVPIFTSISAMPGSSSGSKPSKGGKKSPARAAAAAPSDDDDDIAAEVTPFILSALRQNGDELAVDALPGAVMSIMITESIGVERRKELRDWVRSQGDQLAVEGIALGGGKFALID